jgi:hypothetical protein
MRQMFEVVVAEPVEQSGISWRVRGRAYEDIAIGDMLYLDVTTSDLEGKTLTFQLTSCRSYGKDLAELSGGMTGEIVLHGSHGDLLRDMDVLCSA